jgi:hypothetical protein
VNFNILKQFNFALVVKIKYLINSCKLWSLTTTFELKWNLGSQCTYNVTWGRNCLTIVAVKNKKYCIFRVCVSILSHPACNTHAPYCHMWLVRLYNIFSVSQKQDFRGKNIERKFCVLIFYTTFVWNISHSKKFWARYVQEFILVFI